MRFRLRKSFPMSASTPLSAPNSASSLASDPNMGSTGHVRAVRDSRVDVLRGLAILLVVAGHANRGVIEDHLPSIIDLNILDWFIYAVHMPVFFYLGGYFTYESISKRRATVFVRSRLSNIVYPYLIWSLIYFIFGQIFSHFTQVHHLVSFEDLCAIAWHPINVLWFLYAFLVLQLVASGAGKYPAELFFASLVIDAVLGRIGDSAYGDVMMRTAIHAPFFFAGFLLASRRVEPVWPIRLSSLTKCLGAIMIYLGLATFAWKFKLTEPVQFLTLPVGGVGVGALAMVSSALTKLRSNFVRVLALLGKASLAIYLLHVLALAIIPRTLKTFHADAATPRILLGTVIGTGLSYFAYRLLDRFRFADYLGLR